MMSLLELISQNQPHFQTHKALIVIGLQNDFILPDGKLPVNTRNGFVDRISTLIPNFRKNSSNVIWLQTLYEADRLASDPSTGEGDAVVVGGLVDGDVSGSDEDEDLPKDLIQPAPSRSSRHKQRALDILKKVSTRRRVVPREIVQAIAEEDEELFLLQASKRGPACLRNTPGAEFADAIKPHIEQSDTVVQTTNYSGFLGTRLLLILRAKLVTELYICGCITNVSVLATVVDAARHGIKINVIEDCLGFRKQSRHDEALKRMEEFFDAYIVQSDDINNPRASEDTQSESIHQNPSKVAHDELQAMVERLHLKNNGPTAQSVSSNSSKQKLESPAIEINGRQRNHSDASVAESRKTTDTKLSDKEFMDKLTEGAKIPDQNIQPTPTKQKMVKSKIRMRTRSDKNKKEDDKKSKAEAAESSQKGEATKKGESSAYPVVGDARTPQPKAPKTPKEEPASEKSRRPAVTKSESSDKLRESPLRREASLKSSASQPSLSSLSLESKERSSPSRMRLALSRSSKSESNKAQQELLKAVLASPSKSSVTRATVAPVEQPVSQPTPQPTAAENPSTPISTANSTRTPASNAMAKSKLKSLANFPTMGPGDTIAEGDSRIIHDFFPSDLRHPSDRSRPLKDLIFTQLYNEVHWQKMLHQQGEVPRLVCCQGEFGPDGSMPVYRHPTDQALPLLHFSPKVQVIRKQAEKLAGHPLNHVLIQLYRSGNDYISEHSDKTLDIVRGSSIVNVSFGAQRTMRLRTKKDAKTTDDAEQDSQRTTQRVAMPHNSMFVLGLESNKRWLHGIMADKRLPAERSAEEIAYSGMRISLTFRHIGTFLDAENTTIWGQGATSKAQHDAQEVINDSEKDNESIVRAFSKENHESTFSWEEHYGSGFDVLHFRNPPDDVPILFASHNTVETRMVQIFLAEKKIKHILLEAPTTKEFELDRQVCYRDTDIYHTETINPFSILGYLDRFFPLDRDERGRAAHSASCDIAFFTSGLSKYWYNRQVPGYEQQFVDMLECLEERVALSPGPYITGRRFALGDCAAWPVVDDVVERWEGWGEERFPALAGWWRETWKRRKSVSGLRKELPEEKKKAAVAEAEEKKDGGDEKGEEEEEED